jgi:hypothetical protein
MTHPQVADNADGLQVRNVAVVAPNILKKKLQTAERRGSFSLVTRSDFYNSLS